MRMSSTRALGRAARLAVVIPGLVVLAGLAGAPAWAQDEASVLDQPVEKEGWPLEITRRPLTLAPGMLEVMAPVGINVTKDLEGKPVFFAPSLYYGVTEGFTLGIRHALGLCLSGQDNGCPDVYNDVAVDTLWRLAHGDVGDAAFGASLLATSISDPLALAGEVRLLARFGGPLALALAPSFRFGITERDTPAKASAIAFPLTTYPFGWVEFGTSNREYMSLPVSFTGQLSKHAALSLAAALDAPLDPPTGDFGDFYRIPVGAALVITPARAVDVGASLTFLNLLGKSVPNASRWDARGLQLFAAFRI